jgi:hypothetical protein
MYTENVEKLKNFKASFSKLSGFKAMAQNRNTLKRTNNNTDN